MTREELKERVIKAIEENKDSIIEVGEKFIIIQNLDTKSLKLLKQ